MFSLTAQDAADLYNRAVERQRAGDLAAAVDLYREVLKREPSNPQARSNLATVLFQLGVASFHAGDYPSAVKTLDRAIALSVSKPRLYSYYGMSLLFTGDPDGAAEAFRKELAANPNDYPANFHLAQILASRGRLSEAEPLLRRAVEVRPDSAEAQAALDDALAGRLPITAPQRVGIDAGQPAPVLKIDGVQLPLPIAGRPAVLVFGSYTCPNFRHAAPELNRLADAHGKSAAFLLVYIREAHADDQWQSTINEREKVSLRPATSIQEKQEHARLCTRKLKMEFPAVVDGMEGPAEKAYAAWPSRVYVIGADGRVRYASGLTEQEFDARALENAIRSAEGAP